MDSSDKYLETCKKVNSTPLFSEVQLREYAKLYHQEQLNKKIEEMEKKRLEDVKQQNPEAVTTWDDAISTLKETK